MTHSMAKQMGRVGVLMGGPSSEREISMKSGKAVVSALEEAGCDVVKIVIDSTEEEPLIRAIRNEAVEIAFIALHGAFGEDGTVQKMLEMHHIPYTGSGSRASHLAMNKVLTFRQLREEGLPFPAHVILTQGEKGDFPQLAGDLKGPPLVVKPAAQGSSIGINIVSDPPQYEEAVRQAFELDDEVLVEAYVPGKEITSGVLGEEALPLVEIRPRTAFFDFQAKYQPGMTDYIVPAEISPDAARHIQELSLRAFRGMGCQDFARMDFILGPDDRPFFLEVNTIPGFTATSLLPMAAREAGYSFSELCLQILVLSQKRNKVVFSTKNM